MSTDISNRKRLMLLGCTEFSDALVGWLEEYRQQQKVSGAQCGCYGSEEATADDGEEGYLDEEPYWSDSDTAREMFSDKGVKR